MSQKNETDEYAVYECNCGASIKFHEDEFKYLRWLRTKFGYRNIGDAIGHQRNCCDHPVYASAGHPYPEPYSSLE